MHPKLKVLISLGGWTWSRYFSDAALTEQSRERFVASCVDLFIKGNIPDPGWGGMGGPGAAAGVFDGIDLDWEWPGSEGNVGNVVRPEDKANFTKLAAEFRRQLDAYERQTRKDYLLTAFLPADPVKIDKGFEVNRIFREPRLRDGAGLRPARRVGDGHEPPVQSPHVARRPGDAPLLGRRHGRCVSPSRRAARRARRRRAVLLARVDRRGAGERGSLPAARGTGARHVGGGRRRLRGREGASCRRLHAPRGPSCRRRVAVRRHGVLDLRRPARCCGRRRATWTGTSWAGSCSGS